MADGIHMIDALKSRTIMAKNNIDYYHEMWYKEASEPVKKIHVAGASPRLIVVSFLTLGFYLSLIKCVLPSIKEIF